MRSALLLVLMATSALLAAQTIDTIRPLSVIQRAPVAQDIWGRMLGAPGFVSLAQPVAVAASGDDLYLFDAGPNLFYRFSRAQKTLHELEPVTRALKGVPAGITIAPDKSIYIADPDGHQVLHASYDGTILRALSDNLNLARPVAAVFDVERNNLLAADMLYDHVVGFNHLGWSLFGIGKRGMERDQFQLIIDMAAGPDGIYVVDRMNPYIKIYSMDGRFISAILRQEVSNPAAIVVDEYRRVYVADSFDDTIKVYVNEKYAGEMGGSGTSPGRFRFITDMYIDKRHLYVADSMNQRLQILEIEPPPPASSLSNEDEGLSPASSGVAAP